MRRERPADLCVCRRLHRTLLTGRLDNRHGESNAPRSSEVRFRRSKRSGGEQRRRKFPESFADRQNHCPKKRIPPVGKFSRLCVQSSAQPFFGPEVAFRKAAIFAAKRRACEIRATSEASVSAKTRRSDEIGGSFVSDIKVESAVRSDRTLCSASSKGSQRLSTRVGDVENLTSPVGQVK